jgi:hypothetical protein
VRFRSARKRDIMRFADWLAIVDGAGAGPFGAEPCAVTVLVGPVVPVTPAPALPPALVLPDTPDVGVGAPPALLVNMLTTDWLRIPL